MKYPPSQPVAYTTHTQALIETHKCTQMYIHKHTLNRSLRTNLHSQVKSSMTSSVVTLVMLFTSVTIITVWYLWKREREQGGEKRREEEERGGRREEEEAN